VELSARTRRRLLFAFLAIALFGLDRWSKVVIADEAPLYSTNPVVPGFNIVHTRNTGIAFSLFADASPLVKDVALPALSLVAVAVILVLIWREQESSLAANLALTSILAGAAGNLYDRLAYGYVVDFLDVYVGGWHWPAFNVADSCITVGALALLLGSFTKQSDGAAEPEAESA